MLASPLLLFCDLAAGVVLGEVNSHGPEEKMRGQMFAFDDAYENFCSALGLSSRQATDTIAAATSMAGTLWQAATPGLQVSALYRSDPELAHAIVDLAPRLAHLLGAAAHGLSSRESKPQARLPAYD